MYRSAAVACLVLLASGGVAGDEARWRAEGRHVLVVYAADGADRDGSGKADSQEAAEYYAARRRVPPENLLGLKLRRDAGRRGGWRYGEFFEKILKPVAAKLSTKAPGGEGLSERICYILVCPGTPTSMTTHPRPEQGEKLWSRKTTRRSVDGYLISVAANLTAAVDEETRFPGEGLSGPIGASFRELGLPIFGAYGSRTPAKHFRQLRKLNPQRFGFYLVARLGLDLKSARDMLDGALYAERYLRLPGPDEEAALRPHIWLDQKYGFAKDHVPAMAQTVAIAQGLPGSPFAGEEGLYRVWPLVIDNHILEVGAMVKDPRPTTTSTSQPASGPAPRRIQHKPTVSARIVGGGVDEGAVTLVRPRGGKDLPPVLYFPPGCEVTNGEATATVTGKDIKANQLLLDSTEGFAGGDTIRYVWAGEFPTRDCFLFYGFYGLGRYEDVFQFPPGALGIHVDSVCMNWARGAISRGIAATFGVTSEPLSAGIPYGHQVLLALSTGYDWAEAAYGGLRLAQRWTGVVFGDPLYAPFRSEQLVDRTPPVLAAPSVEIAGGSVTITARLAGKSPDELADVALFKLEYGPTRQYGQTIDSCHWPEPENSERVPGRRFGYSRRFRWTIKGLDASRTYHFRLAARDPAGLETATPDATFKP